MLKYVKENNINIVHFQHEFSFFHNKNALAKLLQDLNTIDVKTIVTLHSFCPKLTAYNFMLAKNASKLLMHAKPFVKEFIAEALNSPVKLKVDNLEYIPMGCNLPIEYDKTKVMQTKKLLNIDSYFPIIGSFGFLRDQKGYRDIVLSLHELKKVYDNPLCLIYAPSHEFGNKYYDETFFKFIEQEKLEKNVLIIREYAKEEKMLKILQTVDLFILNYKDSPGGGGISAAVKTLMSTQRPIITTNSMAFSDLDKEIIRLENTDPQDLAKATQSLLANPQLLDSLIKKANLFLENNSWKNVVEKHIKVYGE